MPSATVEKLIDAAARAADAVPAAEADAVSLMSTGLAGAARAARLVNEQLAAMTRKNIDDQLAAMGALARAKTPQEFWSLQAQLASAALAQYAEQLTSLSQTLSAATSEAARPLREVVSGAVKSTPASA